MLQEVKDTLDKYHPGDAEFHQAVHEVLQDITGFYRDHEKYADYNIAQRMIEPDRIIRFRVCWQDDNNCIRVNRAWRVQFNNALGAYKGGLRFHPSVNESILKFLGFEQTFKNALTGLPMGGAKGGADFDPRGKSEHEIRRFCEALMQELYRHIGEDTDVPAGDINVGTREISYLFGHYLKLTNRWHGVITGKNPLFGGSCGRSEATGYGLVYFLEEMLSAHDEGLKDKRVVISGAGNVALHAAEKCLAEQAQVLSVSDSGGVLYFKDGINTEQLEKIKTLKLEQHGELKAFNGGQYKAGKTPWEIAADIALPCATQNEIDAEAAKQLIENKVLAIAEGANMPLTADAQSLIIDHHILYGPAKAANAGGVAVSGLERTQNAAMRSWDLDKVDSELKTIMKEIHDRCTEHVYKKDGIIPYRRGANVAAFKKIAEALIAFGVK